MYPMSTGDNMHLRPTSDTIKFIPTSDTVHLIVYSNINRVPKNEVIVVRIFQIYLKLMTIGFSRHKIVVAVVQIELEK